MLISAHLLLLRTCTGNRLVQMDIDQLASNRQAEDRDPTYVGSPYAVVIEVRLVRLGAVVEKWNASTVDMQRRSLVQCSSGVPDRRCCTLVSLRPQEFQ